METKTSSAGSDGEGKGSEFIIQLPFASVILLEKLIKFISTYKKFSVEILSYFQHQKS